MIFDSSFFGAQGLSADDLPPAGSRFEEVRDAIFQNAYYQTWGTAGDPPLPVYAVTLGRVLKGLLPFGRHWLFRQAARRAIESRSDLRWGPDRRGFRRLLHPNGVCLTGTWIIDEAYKGDQYSGCFRPGCRALIIARYSTCCTETRRGRYRSLALVGKLFPASNAKDAEPPPTANFITQEDLGGARSRSLSEAVLRNAPNTSPWRRGLGLPILLTTGLVFNLTDNQISNRQLYEVAELGKPADEPTRSPEFMQLKLATGQNPVDSQDIDCRDLDFRDEVLAHIYKKGNPDPQQKLTFEIMVCDSGRTYGLLIQRRTFGDWKRIGQIEFDDAVASYNGDFVIHFHHPPWRNDRNDPSSRARPREWP
jgi:hypothetical protein